MKKERPVVVIETATPNKQINIMTQSDYLGHTPPQEKEKVPFIVDKNQTQPTIPVKPSQVNVNGNNINQKTIQEGGRQSVGAKTMTTNSFKTIIITNPWD